MMRRSFQWDSTEPLDSGASHTKDSGLSEALAGPLFVVDPAAQLPSQPNLILLNPFAEMKSPPVEALSSPSAKSSLAVMRGLLVEAMSISPAMSPKGSSPPQC